jgi:DNA-binding NarL/FixJ family response regulator
MLLIESFKRNPNAVNVSEPIPVVIFCSNPTLNTVLSDYLERQGVTRVRYTLSMTRTLNGARKSLTAGAVAVLAFRIPISEDLELVRDLRREYPEIGIVAIAPMCSTDYAVIVKEAGADALVDPGRLSHDLIAAVTSVAQQKGSSAC